MFFREFEKMKLVLRRRWEFGFCGWIGIWVGSGD